MLARATRTGQGFDGMWVGSPKPRAPHGASIRARLAPVGSALLAAFLVWLAWWFAVRTDDPPTEVHSRAVVLIILGVLIAIAFERWFASLWRRQGSAAAD